MPKYKGNDIRLSHNFKTRLEECLYSLVKIIDDLILNNYYHGIWMTQRESFTASGTQTLEAFVITYALSDKITLGLSKLVDPSNRNWSFYGLIKEIRKFENDQEVLQRSASLVNDFKKSIKDHIEIRHEFIAHPSKKVTHLMGRAQSVQYDREIVAAIRLLDEFVEGQVPYHIEFPQDEAKEPINARILLGLK